MNCAEMRREIDERAHSGRRPDGDLAGHLKSCSECLTAWEDQQNLVRHLGVLRQDAQRRRPAPERREVLLREFAARYQNRPAQRPVRRWTWAVAMAAGLVLMAGVAPTAWDLWNSRGVVLVEATETISDGDGQEGFIAVPYAPAAAAGEVLRVVRTELYPAALASLGVDMDPAWTGSMPADLLVGEDGYPRAVRISSDADGNF